LIVVHPLIESVWTRPMKFRNREKLKGIDYE
jgi:hypothetical protein